MAGCPTVGVLRQALADAVSYCYPPAQCRACEALDGLRDECAAGLARRPRVPNSRPRAGAGGIGAGLWPRTPGSMPVSLRGLPADLPKPAQRAFAAAGYTTLEQLAEVSEPDLARLHGIGPKAIRQLRQALERHPQGRRAVRRTAKLRERGLG